MDEWGGTDERGGMDKWGGMDKRGGMDEWGGMDERGGTDERGVTNGVDAVMARKRRGQGAGRRAAIF